MICAGNHECILVEGDELLRSRKGGKLYCVVVSYVSIMIVYHEPLTLTPHERQPIIRIIVIVIVIVIGIGQRGSNTL